MFTITFLRRDITISTEEGGYLLQDTATATPTARGEWQYMRPGLIAATTITSQNTREIKGIIQTMVEERGIIQEDAINPFAWSRPVDFMQVISSLPAWRSAGSTITHPWRAIIRSNAL